MNALSLHNIMRFRKIILYSLAGILLLCICSYLLLRSQPVQNYLIHRLSAYFSKELKTEIRVGGVNIGFRHIILENLSINDRKKRPVFGIDELKISISDISRRNRTIVLDNLTLDKAYVNLRKYRNDSVFNYQFLVDYFSGNRKSKIVNRTSDKWNIIVKGLDINNSQVNYHIEDKPFVKQGMDYNNISLSDFNLKVRDINLSGDTIRFAVNNLQLKVNSPQNVSHSGKMKNHQDIGFALNDMALKLKVTPQEIIANDFKIKTFTSDIDMNLKGRYSDYADFNDFINKVSITADIRPSKLNLGEVGYFLPAMYGMNDIVSISGDLSGKINSLSSKLFSLKYGKSTEYKGYFSVKGLPTIEKTYINFFSDRLSISKSDIENFLLPSSQIPNRISFPEYLSALGDITVRGDFSGYYNDFIANMTVVSDIGRLKADLSLKVSNQKSAVNSKIKNNNVVEYAGNIIASNLNLGKLTSMKDLGKANLKVNITGRGLDSKHLLVNLTGVIDTLYYKNYRYHNINLEGNLSKQKFDGHVSVKDENVSLDFDGKIDYSGLKPIMNFEANIQNANLNKLNLAKKDTLLSDFSGLFRVNMEGSKLDDLQGEINITDAKYTEGNEEFSLDKLTFSAYQKENNYKALRLNSDYVDADITGNFTFSRMYESFITLMNAYLPSFYKVKIQKSEVRSRKSDIRHQTSDIKTEEKFEYDIKLKKTGSITKLFIPQLKIADSSEVRGKYNSIANTFTVKASSPSIHLKRNRYVGWYLDAAASKGVLIMNTGCKSLFLSDSISLNNIKYGIVAKNDTLKYKLIWDNKLPKNNTLGDISGIVSFRNAPKISVNFSPSRIIVNDSLWIIEKGNKLNIDSSSLSVNALEFIFKNEKIKFDGKISRNPDDKLFISFENFNIANLDYFTIARNIDLDGIVNGTIAASDLYGSPNLIASINIRDLIFNRDKLGQLNFSSTWDSRKDAISTEAEIVSFDINGQRKSTPLSIKGFYYPSRNDNNFDLNVEADHVHIKWLESYISSFASGVDGFATGKLRLTGPASKPELDGKLSVTDARMKIDYLNTRYTFAGDIELNKSEIVFDDLLLHGDNPIDPKKNKAELSGKIYHTLFSRMRLAMILKLQNLACLNTTEKDNILYYGNAVASGTVKLSGPIDNININAEARTEKGTAIFIPLNNSEELTDNSFITFEHTKNSNLKHETLNSKHQSLNSLPNTQNPIPDSYHVNLNGIQLNFDLEVTPDAEIQLIFDPKIGDIITAHGNGDIKLEINTNGNFNMYGDYVVRDGNYLFTLKKVINKHFTIVNGGRISWNGNPYEGRVDLQAVYNVRTSVDILRPDREPTGKKISVDCNIFLKDLLLKPNVEFSITFPERTNDFSLEPYKAAIEPDLNKQVFSLLVLRSFTTPPLYSGESYVTSGNNPYLSNSTEMVFDQVGNLLSQINKDVDVGVKYHQGDQMTSDQVEVALATQLFSNRLLINGDLGVGGANKVPVPIAPNATPNSQIVGDVNLEYKITQDGKLRAKAFNKSNIYEYIDYSSPYTQGVGIFYRKEFDFFWDLFKSRKSKENAHKDQQ
jgi:hypothetical protein